MAITRGTVTKLEFSGATPAAQNVTVAANCKQIRIFSSNFQATLDSCSVGGSATTQAVTAGPTGNSNIISIRYIDSPATGTVAIQPVYSGSPSEGPIFYVEQITADGTLSVIDADADVKDGVATASATSTSNTGDFVTALGATFDSEPTINGTLIDQQTFNSDQGKLFDLTAGAATTNATCSSEYASVALIVVRETAAPEEAAAPQGTGLFSLGFGL